MPSSEELAQLYANPHQHERWTDHRIRVDVTSILAYHLLEPGNRVVDLSCGDAAVAQRLASTRGARLTLGDFAPGYELQGPIEETALQIPEASVHLWLLNETLEHLDDPDAVLRLIRPRTRRLILTTPAWEADDSNPEHIWSWSPDDVEQMLCAAGFKPLIHNLLDLRLAGFLYAFSVWACE